MSEQADPSFTSQSLEPAFDASCDPDPDCDRASRASALAEFDEAVEADAGVEADADAGAAGGDPFHARATLATQAGAHAFARLLRRAEEGNSGQTPRIARFLAASYNGQAFRYDLFELRAVDIAISDDMLCCLDALRWGLADLHRLIPDGDVRLRDLIARWGLS